MLELTPRLRLFFAICAAIFSFNLLTMNDLQTFWDGAEAALLWRSLHPDLGFYLPATVLQWFSGAASFAFGVRLPGAGLLVLTFVAVFYMGRRLFGDLPVLLMLLVSGASLLLPALAKLATADVWILAAHWVGYLAMLRFLKQPAWGWRLLFYGALALGWLVAPVATAIFFGVSGTVLYLSHPQRGQVLSLFPWAALLGLLGWSMTPAAEVQVLGFQWLKLLGYTLLGLAPFIGFCLAGFPDVLRKYRRQEELSIIIVGWLLGGLLSGTLMLTTALAFMAAKQITAYFDPKYPFKAWVRGAATLHLVLAFCGATVLMVNGFYEFKGIGFRSGLVLSFLYWICSLMGVIGLYGMEKKQVLTGPAMAGLLATTVFWLQINPLLEIQRSVPKVVAEAAAALPAAKTAGIVCIAPAGTTPVEAVYAHLAADSRSSIAASMPEGAAVLILRDSLPASFPASRDTVAYRGWLGYFETVRYWVAE